MMNKKIILFNGPPGAGKDTVAELLAFKYSGKVEKFAAPIKENCRNIYGLTQEQWNQVDGSQEAKAQPHEFFFGQTCRQVQINFSELFLKPTHDKFIFGNLLARRLKQAYNNLFFISDSGFAEEAMFLETEFGSENIFLIRLHREGHTYDGDSRSYVHLETVQSLDIENNGSIEDTITKIEEFLKEKGAL